jgi:hypothetical protein
MAVRAGEPINLNAAPYITTAGTTGASAHVLDTQQGGRMEYHRPVIIQNLDGTNAVFIKINDDDASSTDCHIRLGANERVKIDWVNVTKLSAYMSAGAYTTLMVHGWTNS